MSAAPSGMCRRCGAELEDDARFCSTCGTRRSAYVDADVEGLQRGWYPDPFGGPGDRFFDGVMWTAQVQTDAPLISNPPITYSPRNLQQGAWTGTAGSLALSIVGLAAAFGLSFLFVLPLILTHRPGGEVVVLIVSEAGLWTGLFLTCRFESRRYGSGSLRADYRIRIQATDVAVAVGGSIVARVIAGAVLIPFLRDLGNPDQRLYSVGSLDLGTWVVFALLVCVGAPIFEELFFRGLLQGQLVERFGVIPGVTVTSLLFGSVHFFNDPGVGGLLLALSVGAGGLVLGSVRHLTGRLGASMATHALFNLVPTLVLLSAVR